MTRCHCAAEVLLGGHDQADPGVVDQRIEAPYFARDALGEFVDEGLRSHIAAHRERLRPGVLQLPHSRIERLHVQQDHAISEPRQQRGGGEPDPLRRAGDEGGLQALAACGASEAAAQPRPTHSRGCRARRRH